MSRLSRADKESLRAGAARIVADLAGNTDFAIERVPDAMDEEATWEWLDEADSYLRSLARRIDPLLESRR